RMLNAIFGNHGVRRVDGRWLAYFTGIARKRGSMRSMRSSYIDGEPALYAVDPLTAKWTLVPGAAASQGERFSWLLGSDGTVAATLATDILRGSWQLKAPGGLVLAQGTSA